MTIELHWPQIIYLMFWVASFVASVINHGKPIGNYNFWETIASFIICFSLLTWGGFF